MKRLMTILATAALIGLAGATPAGADEVQHPISARMQLEYLGVPCPEHVPPFLTWAGTVEIDGMTYGWADFPTAPLVDDGKFVAFEEYWTIFTLEDEAVTAELACDADLVLLAGVNDGWGSPGLTGRADGAVTYVADDGEFDEVAPGSRMFWRGKVTDDAGTRFRATLHILPPR
jgi:hypothetical protein